ncbi:MAG: NfuA family Fe-S biogenesis protein [Buchnera aphidicola (Pentalonia nigronervosa)]|uniref:Fe/S biogenesis protein NfuA n=1 Tax=Buchnera aphidicola (Pentalonia nigronervosa) TaxID=1309793 RepID=A0A7H1AZ12_9GAMM|nr:MAG: NfuA family Fe-S biogenesis protein [Buchnera aphidicola (Pentalonia nigronervosa)]
MIHVSKNAQKHFLLLLSKEPIGTQIRAFISNPGTELAECGIAYCLKHEVEPSDIQLSYNNFSIYINESVISFFKNAEIDLIVDNLGTQLTLKTPYAKVNVQKPISLEDKIKHFFITEINPQLSMHGGKVNLVKIENKNIVVVEFSGGCNGCAMIDQTLKETIEKKIIYLFPEVQQVRDVTQHAHGQHSFY